MGKAKANFHEMLLHLLVGKAKVTNNYYELLYILVYILVGMARAKAHCLPEKLLGLLFAALRWSRWETMALLLVFLKASRRRTLTIGM